MKFFLNLILISMTISTYSQTKVIAHRGAFKAQNLPENTIAALYEAAHLGCFASEFDVHITKDGKLIVNHDDDVNGLIISERNFDELNKNKLSNGESIPTLETYLIHGKNFPKMRLVLEVKKSKEKEMTMEAARKSVELVQKLKLENQVDYITFDFEAGKLISEAKEAGYNGLDYHYSVYKKQTNWIQEAKNLGMTINAWTVNEEADMNWLITEKADFITTNEPELLIRLLQK